jgi:hypothetical protein
MEFFYGWNWLGDVYKFGMSFIVMWVYMGVLLLSVVTCVFLLNKFDCFVSTDVFMLPMATCSLACVRFIIEMRML